MHTLPSDDEVREKLLSIAKNHQTPEGAAVEIAGVLSEGAVRQMRDALLDWIRLGENLGFVTATCGQHNAPELLPVTEAEIEEGGDPCYRVLFLTLHAQRALEDE